MQKKDLNTFRTSTTRIKPFEEILIKERLGTSRPNEPLQAVVENQLSETALEEQNNSVLERNRALLQYTATIADSNSTKDEFNYEFVEALVKGGANINTADQNEQTIFHEVARSWNTDVARFLIDLGCDINKKDRFGRTPLHVSAAVDFVEMTEFLLVNNADINSKTHGELQVPLHYAAKNGATRSLKMLLSFHANIDALDAKKRTPLQVSAEWSRGKVAKILIDEGASSCLLDITGNSALCVLIDRLPNLAVEALNQLHSYDVITMRESYYLQYLEASREKYATKKTRTALETAVANRKYEVITHPVMQRLVRKKWKQFGWMSTAFDLGFHVIFGIVWTVFALGTPEQGEDFYSKFSDRAWKITIGVVIILMTLFDIGKQIQATLKSRRSQRDWVRWKIEQLEYDLKFCHPRWPQEEKFVKHEIKRVRSLPLFDAYDAWFYMDWVILFLILATIGTHFVLVYRRTDATRYLYTRTISIVNLLVWLRLLKFVRPFSGIGTLVLILSETLGDFLNWAFLFFLIMVPFAASFWINFGAISTQSARGYHTTGELLYRVFQMAVGDDFNLESMVEKDAVMARILVVLYVTAMTIVTLNLLIALLSETFTRVYNNAVANTIMQRAIKIVESERILRKRQKLRYREYMRLNCSPEVIKILPVSWNEGRARKATEQEICENLVDLKNILDDRFGKIYGKDKSSDFDSLVADLKNVCEHQNDMTNELEEIRKMLDLHSSGKSPRHISIKAPRSRDKRGSRSRGSSPPKEQPKGLVSAIQDLFPTWLTGSVKESSSRGNGRKHRPKAASQTTDGGRGEKRRRRRRRPRQSSDVAAANIRRGEGESRENDLRRRGRRNTRGKKKSVVEGYPNPGYDGELAWDTVSIDSASL
ncbi:transient receptor potential cation channel subfamily V member 3-like isoform X2 [Dendronephthya gigantea]|uniref:transient receptor potential cation channel subfamily V member 3-like isoform X2 n=1 Tax=Dendronephthya gigantea TaxID=151771 RepID=UPI001069FA46|nr:transient receptor potential cation channel subfamily V member 3-like isoform X2 [Dendronephthya gigantea]